MRQRRRALPSRFGGTVGYYVAASCLLPVGAALGTALARGVAGAGHEQLVLAHVSVNVLGWIGLTIVGTLGTLWPTMLRTRIASGAEQAARRALPVLIGAIGTIATGALTGQRLLAALGLVGHLAGLAIVGRPVVVTARAKPPASYATWSVATGLSRLLGCLTVLVIGIGTASSWAVVGDRIDRIAPLLAVGFAAQVLLGALSYLVPVALGGGPAPVRAATAALNRGGSLRVVVNNAALPVPGTVRAACSVLVLAGLAAFVPLLAVAMRAPQRARRTPSGPADTRPGGQLTGATGPAWQWWRWPSRPRWRLTRPPSLMAPGARRQWRPTSSAAPDRPPRWRCRHGTCASPKSSIEVPASNRLMIELSNTDPTAVHDLVLASGQHSARLAPGGSTRLDVGVVTGHITGWCSVAGHRQLGMVLDIGIRGIGSGPAPLGGAAPTAAKLDFQAAPGPGFVPADALLPALSAERVQRLTLAVRDVVREVAPGVTQRLWTYNGTAPGPTLHGRIGDVFVITLVNDASMGHSIDFHAGALAPDQPMRTIAPGESLNYRFAAMSAGVWMYHCSTMPMSAHIANGMFGAVVIEPPDLPVVARSYLLVQSELYLGPPGGSVDAAKVAVEKADAVVFNWAANQYDHQPLPARVGERVRVWVLDAGPNQATSFHVVGAQLDTTYLEGDYLLARGRGASQALALALAPAPAPAQGGFVELSFPEAGHYPFVSHLMVDAERGAHGNFDVTG